MDKQHEVTEKCHVNQIPEQELQLELQLHWNASSLVSRVCYCM
jgi:hypothetical protein